MKGVFNLKKKSILAVFLSSLLFLCIGYFLGKYCDMPANRTKLLWEMCVDNNSDDKSKDPENKWLETARAKYLRGYTLIYPREDDTANLWVGSKDSSFRPIIRIQDRQNTGRPDTVIIDNISTSRKSVSIASGLNDADFNSLFLFVDGTAFVDFDMNGTWDARSETGKAAEREVRIGSEWYPTFEKDGKRFIRLNDKIQLIEKREDGYHLADE